MNKRRCLKNIGIADIGSRHYRKADIENRRKIAPLSQAGLRSSPCGEGCCGSMGAQCAAGNMPFEN